MAHVVGITGEKMEYTREIYWNVGHNAGTLVPMYLFAFAAIGLLVKGFLRRIADI